MSRELDYHYQGILEDRNEEIKDLEKEIEELYEVISKYEKYLNDTYEDNTIFKKDSDIKYF